MWKLKEYIRFQVGFEMHFKDFVVASTKSCMVTQVFVLHRSNHYASLGYDTTAGRKWSSLFWSSCPEEQGVKMHSMHHVSAMLVPEVC
eukprot:6492721-Amphidinium_carterae.7